MSLNFELGDIKNWKTVTAHPDNADKMNPVTNQLIWLTLTLAVGTITEKSIDEFWWRMRFIQRLDGPNLSYIDEKNEQIDIYITKQDLRDHLGLRTNVTTMTRAKWFSEQVAHETQPEVRQEKSAREMIADHHAKIRAMQPA
jgi:hypothetical protein